MQSVGGRIEADVSRDTFSCQQRVKGLPVVAVFQEAPFGEGAQQV